MHDRRAERNPDPVATKRKLLQEGVGYALAEPVEKQY